MPGGTGRGGDGVYTCREVRSTQPTDPIVGGWRGTTTLPLQQVTFKFFQCCLEFMPKMRTGYSQHSSPSHVVTKSCCYFYSAPTEPPLTSLCQDWLSVPGGNSEKNIPNSRMCVPSFSHGPLIKSGSFFCSVTFVWSSD